MLVANEKWTYEQLKATRYGKCQAGVERSWKQVQMAVLEKKTAFKMNSWRISVVIHVILGLKYIVDVGVLVFIQV